MRQQADPLKHRDAFAQALEAGDGNALIARELAPGERQLHLLVIRIGCGFQ